MKLLSTHHFTHNHPATFPEDLELREQPDLIATQLCFRFAAKGAGSGQRCAGCAVVGRPCVAQLVDGSCWSTWLIVVNDVNN